MKLFFYTCIKRTVEMLCKEELSLYCKEDPPLYCKEGFPLDYKDDFDHSRICSLTVYLQKYHQKYNIQFMLQLFCDNDCLSDCVCAFEFFIQEELLNTGKEPAEVFEKEIFPSFLDLVIYHRRYKYIPYIALYGFDMNKKIIQRHNHRYFSFEQFVKTLFYKLYPHYHGSEKNFIETYKTLCMYGCDDSNILSILIRHTKAPYRHMKVLKFSLSKEINSKPISYFFMGMYREQLEREGISD